jgi:hypothetical protein
MIEDLEKLLEEPVKCEIVKKYSKQTKSMVVVNKKKKIYIK